MAAPRALLTALTGSLPAEAPAASVGTILSRVKGAISAIGGLESNTQLEYSKKNKDFTISSKLYFRYIYQYEQK